MTWINSSVEVPLAQLFQIDRKNYQYNWGREKGWGKRVQDQVWKEIGKKPGE